jgi:alpha-ketoglutarate-dependent taurine dioxygenase
MSENSSSNGQRSSSLQGFKRKTTRVGQEDLLRYERIEGHPDLPLVVRPNAVDVDLSQWTAQNRDFISKKLVESGAILFRGFNIDSVEKFRQYSLALSPNLDNYNERTSPRHEFGENIFSSTEYPADQVLHFHNANSYSHFWPMKIWFACVIKSPEGGRTPIGDCRKVLRYLEANHPRFIERLEKTQVLYQRNFIPGVGLSWQETFQTNDRDEVSAYCRDADIDFTWESDNHLRTRQVRQAVAVHPITGERVWFNQLLLFHVSQLEPGIAEKFLKGFKDEDLPSNSYYGDGSPFALEDLQAVLDAYEHAKIGYDWEQGDVALLDNMLVAHSREPFRGKRLITVAFSGRHFAKKAGETP